MGISAKKASELVGLTKHAILKAIREGRISANKNENGQWVIEPVELYRVYEPVKPVNYEQKQESKQQNTPKVNSFSDEKEIELELNLKNAEEKISMLQNQLEKSEEREKDLSMKLDKAQSTIEKQTYLISDMRENSPQKPVERDKKFLGIFPYKKS